MPEHVEIPNLPQLTSLVDEPYKTPDDILAPYYALSLVNLTFFQFENYRQQNHDRRWNTHDALFFGWVPPRTWDGTVVPRSTLGVPITFDQVESALPIISQSLFGTAEWFQVEAEPGTDPAEARDVRDALAYILEHPKDDVGTNAISEIELAIINILLYGNGGIAVEYDPMLRRPSISWVDIRDIYIDPGLSVPNFEESRCIIRRKWFTVSELDDLRSDPRFDVPTEDQLWTMAQNQPNRVADQTKRVQEALRGIYYSPGASDYIPDPAEQKIEVLIYYSKNRIIWVANQRHVLYNQPNQYGCLPFCFAPCYIVPGRAYGMSIADVQESNQRYIEALLNGRLDQVTLDLQPPRVGKRGTLMTPAQQKWRPGAYYTQEDAKDMQLLQPTTSLTNVYTEIQYIEGLSYKRTGVNSMGQGGVPTPSNANRTASGMQMQMGGANSRISHIVGNIERYLIVPMLYKLHRVLKFHSDIYGNVPGQSTNGAPQRMVPGSSVQRRVRFKMDAVSKMLTRDKLMQIVPFLEQTLLQGPLVQELHAVGKTVDFEVIAQMIQDAAGIASTYKIVRPLSQEEIQHQQQQQQQQQNPMIQKAQMEGQTRKDIMGMKIQGELQKAQISKSSPQELQAQMMQKYQEMQFDQQKQQAQMAADQQSQQQELMMQAAMNKIKIEAEKQKHALQMQKHHMTLQQEARQAAQDAQIAQMTHGQKMQQILQQLQVQKAAQDAGLDASGTPSMGGGAQVRASQAQTPQGAPGRTDRQPRQSANPRHRAKPPTA